MLRREFHNPEPASKPSICEITRQVTRAVTRKTRGREAPLATRNEELLAGYQILYYNDLTIIPRARMGSESIAHEVEGRIGY